jgi:hypothetical protein
MKDQNFSLWPFQPADSLPHLKITGNVARRSNEFAIRYAIHGQLAELVIPGPTDIPGRRNGLWEETCFEFFLAVKDSPGYWEFNLSPPGHWNVYRFAAYRQGMQEEMAFTSLPFRVQKQSDALRLALELDLDKIVKTGQILEVAISAVIKPKKGEVTYWALTHCGPQPDFHRRDSFILEL